MNKRYGMLYADGSLGLCPPERDLESARREMSLSSDDGDTQLVECELVIVRSFGCKEAPKPEHTFLPTCGAQEGKGSSQARYRGSPNFRGAKMSEGLRTCRGDPIYLNPSFAEAVMGLKLGYTELETETRHA